MSWIFQNIISIFSENIYFIDLNKSPNVLSESFNILIEFFSMEGEYIFDDLQMLNFTSKNIWVAYQDSPDINCAKM